MLCEHPKFPNINFTAPRGLDNLTFSSLICRPSIAFNASLAFCSCASRNRTLTVLRKPYGVRHEGPLSQHGPTGHNVPANLVCQNGEPHNTMAAMPHWLIHGAVIAGRLLAAVNGCVCFYLAVFMYEVEEGQWNNRLEDLWVRIDDLSKATEQRSIAIINRIAGTLSKGADWVFGHKLLSLRTVAASLNLSLFALTTGLLILSVSMGGPSLWAFVTLAVLAGSIALPAFHPRIWTYFLALAPMALVFVRILTDKPSNKSFTTTHALEALVLSIFYSLFSDILAIAIIRRLFKSMSSTITVFRMVLWVIALLLVPLALIPLPLISMAISWTLWGHGPVAELSGLGGFMGLAFNLSTYLYCFAPMFLLIIAVTHRVVWPTVSRLVYSLHRFKLVSNKKLLIATGCLLWSIALNLETVAVKDLLKLIG